MINTLLKTKKLSIITLLTFVVIFINLNINVHANTTETTAKGNLGEFADEYEVAYDLGGRLTTGNTVATLKFNTANDIEVSGTLKINTIATLMFDQNPYRIVYEKGLSDDEWTKYSSKPSWGYPKSHEMLFDSDEAMQFRSYYEDNKERLGRSYKIRFDSNDSKDGNGSTIATLVDITKTEVPVLESLDYKNTKKYKQSITEDNSLISIRLTDGTIKTENRGFDGTLFFKHWSLYNQFLQKEEIYDSLEDMPSPANFSGDFGAKVVATAIWEKREFKYGSDFSGVTRVGYNFLGWKSLRNPNIGLLNDRNKVLTVNPCPGNSQNDYSKSEDYSSYIDVLQAQWKPKKYRLIMDGNQPEGTHTIQMRLIEFDSKIGELPTPVIDVPNTQYVFKGWYTAKVGGEPVKLRDTWTYTHGIIIYAHWEINTHVVGDDPEIDPEIGEYDYLVPESQIVRVVELSDNDKEENILNNRYWDWSYNITCKGHQIDNDTYYCTSFDPEGLAVDNINFNNSAYTRFISAITPWYDFSYILEHDKSYDDEDVIVDDPSLIKDGDVENKDSVDLTNTGTVKTRHNYDIAFHRGKDSLTLANTANNIRGIDVKLVDILDTFVKDDVSHETRETNGHYKENTNIMFRGDSAEALVKQSITGEEVCEDGGGTIVLNSGDFDKHITVAFRVYKGNSGETPNATASNANNKNIINNVDEKLTVGSNGQYYKNGDRIPSGLYDSTTGAIKYLDFNFYPYIRMRYDTIDKGGNITIDNEIYVLGEYKRRLSFSDYAEVVFKKNLGYEDNTSDASGFSLKIESSQWLNDKSAQEFNTEYNIRGLDESAKFDKDMVLPGGATLSLSTPAEIRQHVIINTYQVTLSDAGKAQVEKSTGSTIDIPTVDTIKKEHLNYVETVRNALDMMEINQWQYYHANKEELKTVHQQWIQGDVYSHPGIEVYAGADLKTFFGIDGFNPVFFTKKTSSESKYYFRDLINSEIYANKDNRNDIDVRTAYYEKTDGSKAEVPLKHAIYTFKVDTSGNIWVETVKDGMTTNKVILTQEQDESKLTGDIKELNDKTLVVTKLRDALQYNSGDDNGATWVTDGDWYNEAFDGVVVHLYTSELETGLIDNNSRTQVFDPVLNTTSEGKDSSFRTFALNQFRTQNYSNAYGSLNKYQIGEFKGQKVHMADMETLYVSKPFFNTNVTVQDKH